MGRHPYSVPGFCLGGKDEVWEEMDLLSFIRTADPTKGRVGESELKASVEKLFDEGGNGSHTERGDSVSGGHGVDIPQVSVTAEIVAEDAAPVQLKRQRKRKTVVSDAGEPSHPPKKLREDHGTSTGHLLLVNLSPHSRDYLL
ncbi:hypothetical protein Tco_1407839 [Tanacetum coccineum]